MARAGNPFASLGPMAKAYDFAAVETPAYEWWEGQNYFKPNEKPGAEPFTIVMPPPNVTGALHLGHALESAIQDAMVRWRRMQGYSTLWLPGTDHAGIATQLVVERDLLAKNEVTRHELGREKFLERVWQWVDEYGDVIQEQRKRLGASCDWDRATFTMDPGPAAAVRRTFVRLYKKDLIYRGNRIVNWCPVCRTALSDLEVIHEERETYLYKFRYPIADEDDYVVIATTRPETMLGDTAVAVNPEDDRYRHLIGKSVELPLTGRIIPIISDAAVDVDFGTGALKVTPAHDPADFEIGRRHGLETVTVIGLDGRMTEDAGEFAGMDRSDARAAVLEALDKIGLLEAEVPYTQSIALCDRSKDPVEPLSSLQWWVKEPAISKVSRKAVEEGKIKFVPERFTRVYYNWIDNLRDWCISRQLWWGHRIPVWYCDDCDETIVEEEDPTECPSCNGHALRQDEDVLDTWFSSGLWPLSTLNWPPEEAEDFQKFYPTSVMECGRDILFLWVSRMITLGIENTGEIPFHTVYLHGLLQDPSGSKMSKTKGNVIDPLELIEMYGTDAVRFALTTGVAPGNESRLSHPKMESGRNFANKLWNAARFVTNSLDAEDAEVDWSVCESPEHPEDRWVVSRQNRLAAEVDRYLDEYQIGEAQRILYDFIWSEYCDWYLELAKVRIRSQSGPSPLPYLADVLEKTLRLLHPFMPFVTEQIWQHLKIAFAKHGRTDLGESIMIAEYPVANPDLFEDDSELNLETLMDVVRSIRNVRAELRIDPVVHVNASIASDEAADFLASEKDAIEALARAAVDISANSADQPVDAVTVVLSRATVAISMDGDFDLAAARDHLADDLGNATAARARLEGRLNNEQFLAKAPDEVVEKERTRLAEIDDRITRLRQLVGAGD